MPKSNQARMLDGLCDQAREYHVSDGRRLIMVCYPDRREHNWLTTRVDAGQRSAYTRENLWRSGAKGNPVRGKHVHIRAFVEPATHEPVAALREVHARNWREVTRLPSFRRFSAKRAFSREGLSEFAALAQGRPVAEMAGLWKKEDYPADVRIALYRLCVQDAIQENKLWFMGVVGHVYEELIGAYGPSVVRTLGSAVIVKDRDATRDTRITPILVRPATLYADLLSDISRCTAKGDSDTAFVRRLVLWEHLRGWDMTRLDAEVATALRELLENA